MLSISFLSHLLLATLNTPVFIVWLCMYCQASALNKYFTYDYQPLPTAFQTSLIPLSWLDCNISNVSLKLEYVMTGFV